MPNPNKRFAINFNVQLDDQTDTMLIRISKDLSLSKAHIVRSAIRNYHNMKFLRAPICADGQQCRAPHTHIFAPTNPPSDPDIDTVHLDRP